MFVPNCRVPKGFPEVCGSRPRQVLTDCRLGNQYAYFSVEGSEAQGERRRVLSHSPGSLLFCLYSLTIFFPGADFPSVKWAQYLTHCVLMRTHDTA